MKSFYLAVLISVLGEVVVAQNIISGKITDQNNNPIEMASVVLRLAKDSVLVKSTLSNVQGNYQLVVPLLGHYTLDIMALGYKKLSYPVSLNSNAIQLQAIALQSTNNTLNEVIVTASRPFLEQNPDKLVINVEGSVTAAGSSAMEVLQKVPGVLVSDDKISLVGKGSPVVYIDGRQSQYTDVNQLLKDISASDIRKIELISNPGSKYDAAGAAVINIVLKKSGSLGTNGSLAYTSGIGIYDNEKLGLDQTFMRNNPSLTINNRKGKMNTFASYGFVNRNRFERTQLNRDISPSRFEQINYKPNDVQSHNYKLGLDYYANDKNTFGIVLKGFNRNGSGQAQSTTQQFQLSDEQLNSKFFTNNNTTTERNNFSGNLNWKHSFDTTGRELNMDVDYSRFKVNTNSLIVNTLQDGSFNNNQQLVNNPVKFGVVKVDYTLPLAHLSKLELGAKTSLATIDSYLQFRQRNAIDPLRSTDFLYKENINALYASYQKKLTNWDIQAGLRAEQTKVKGSDKAIEVLNRNYVQLFPSFFLTRKINNKIATVLQYSRRVNRPGYQQQNPFIEFLDSLTYTKGNPTLRPETANQYKLSVTYQNQPLFSLSYNDTKDIIFENAPKQDGNLTFTTVENLAQFQNFTAELNLPITIGKKISGFGGNQMVYNYYNANYLGAPYKRGKWNWMAYWQINYKLISSFSFEVSGYYMTQFLQEFLIIEQRGALNLALRKSFLNNKLKLSLSGNDILLSDVTRARIQFQQINVNFTQYQDSRSMRFGLSYSFGNQKLKDSSNRKTASDDEANRVKNTQ
ncbi:MAG: TonB-dependent receptor [Sphingobacteriales bacterium]|nr:MAG: TonB-dependent receptor [Sphingobacteriales bacterium]